MKIVVVIVVFILIFGSAFYLLRIRTETLRVKSISSSSMSERVELKTKDNVAIVGDYYVPGPPAGRSAKGLLLLHMMPATRSSWQALAMNMQAKGFHVLAIDLRGHGESQGGPDGYKSFSDAEHQASSADVEAGVEFLKSKGITILTLGGASIGANLALQYLGIHHATKAAFLLSPGLNYRGVKTESAARGLTSGQAVYYVASHDDATSADATQKLFDATPERVEKKITLFETAGHGTTMFERESGLMDTVALWLLEVTR